MPDATPAAAAPITASPATLRIVLFGQPDAGKSSLLGALAQAAQTQEHLFTGRLVDLSQGLARLQHRLYDGEPRETLEEVVPFAVQFEPFFTGASAAALPGQAAVLFDCNGRAANEILSRRRPLAGNGALVDAVLSAECLIVAIDISAPPTQVEADFAEFGRFLRLLWHNRGERTEIAGLPVFVVLTKCDLIARADEPSASWLERIEERKRDVSARFTHFLEREKSQGSPIFGSIDLHVWATAVKRPALLGSPARLREPFGVAELFRQAFASAADFRGRDRRSRRRLLWTASGTASAVALMAALAAILFFAPPAREPSALASQVALYRSREGHTPASRLREPLGPKISELTEMRNHPEFASLPVQDQAFVQRRLQELVEYTTYRDKLERVRLADLKSADDLDQLEARLKTGDLALPAPYAVEWSQTTAGLLHARLLADVALEKTGLTESEAWYRKMTQKAEELRTFAAWKPSDARSWSDWQNQADSITRQTFPHTDEESLPGSHDVSYGTLSRLPRVADARRDWEAARLRLARLSTLVSALGLAGTLPGGERAPLDIPENFPVSQAGADLERLDRLYPSLRKDVVAGDLPDAVAANVRRAARSSYDHLLLGGREVVLAHLQALGDGEESESLWRRLAEWLTAPKELADWRQLATLLLHIQGPEASDPVTALADFLRQDRFEIEIQQLTMEVPYDRKLRPAGKLTVYHGPAHAPGLPALVFKLIDDDGRRDPDRRITSYSFTRDTGVAFSYRPGDTLYASLPVKLEGAGDWLLTWSRCRSEVFQFERLVRPPRLHARDQDNLQGELVEDLVIIYLPEHGIPRVPDLLPIVKPKKR
jgi:hypothetical protein